MSPRRPPADRGAGAVDGALVIDKPRGLTSHDVVAAVRRALGESRVGHTGTLDPLATGVLPLLLGRATRLAQFVSAASKTYDAIVRVGWETDTDDETGEAVTTPVAPALDAGRIEAALAPLRGEILQRPPAFSAKKVGGRRAYALARESAPPELAPVRVTVHRLDLLDLQGDRAVLRIHCSAGCYVRALARDLGRALGVGAHLTALRRLTSGRFGLADALPLDDVLRDADRARAAVRPAAEVVGDLPAVEVHGEALGRAAHGGVVRLPSGTPAPPPGTAVRLVDPGGRLVAIARPADGSGALHPFVVLV